LTLRGPVCFWDDFAVSRCCRWDSPAGRESDAASGNIGVILNVYEFSTPAEKQILIQAFEKGQNQGLVNALGKM
jgi:hypothetical protein